MLGEINGHSSTDSRVWLSRSDGSRFGLFCLFRMANNNKYDRPSSTRDEGNYYQTNRSTSFIRPGHDKITTKSQYSITAKRAGGIG